MKQLTIGRANDADVVITNASEQVSRYHATIAFNFWGKMSICDTSSNGTYINDIKIQKNVWQPVSRQDIVRLGDNYRLDWTLVPDPSKGGRITTFFFSLMLVLAIGAGVTWMLINKSAPKTPIEVVDSDSIAKPDTVVIEKTVKKKPKKKHHKKQERHKTKKKKAVDSSIKDSDDY